MRYSQDHRDETRKRLISAAVKLLHEAGFEGATVQRIAAAAGLTHGAVYKHFPGKDALLYEALPVAAAAFRHKLGEAGPDEGAALEAYLSEAHRDHLTAGCPLAAVAGYMPRAEAATRAIFERELVAHASLLRSPSDMATDEELARISLLIGGLLLSRGVNSADLSGRILETCQRLAGASLVAADESGVLVGDRAPSFSPLDRLPRREAIVLGARVSYVDVGAGTPVVFLNSPMFTSYCWRNVVPRIAATHRCLVPDLVGVGRSGPAVEGRYGFHDQSRHVEAWLDGLGLDGKVIFVGHEWGATIAFDIAARRPDSVAGFVHFGAVLPGMSYDSFPAMLANWHRQLRDGHETAIYEDDRMLERQYRRSTLRRLSEAELDVYRSTWREQGTSRAPLLHMTLDMPIEGQPAAATAHLAGLERFMAGSPIPKLFIRPTPGWRRVDPDLAAIRRWPNQTEISVPGVLLVMEDSPDQIADALRAFLRQVAAPARRGIRAVG